MVYAIDEKKYLQHHGIKGQKWGIRRYQNYDGSYTRAGMKRYNASLEKFEKAAERYKTAKKTKDSDTELANARLAKRKAQRQLNKDYKHLKQDKLADQGKELYSKGKTITNSKTVTHALSKYGTLSITTAAYLYKTGKTNGTVINALSAIGGLSIAAAAAKSVRDSYQAKRLKAYYTHTSSY